MAKKNRAAHGGGHGWFVTFADLMGLMMSFFVMLVAFSTQDQKKLQIVAGSMREAFGVQTQVRYSGIVEVDGVPTRPRLKNVARIPPEDASANPTPDDNDKRRQFGAFLLRPGAPGQRRAHHCRHQRRRRGGIDEAAPAIDEEVAQHARQADQRARRAQRFAAGVQGDDVGRTFPSCRQAPARLAIDSRGMGLVQQQHRVMTRR